MPELPRVTQSVADLFSTLDAENACGTAPANAPVASAVFRKSRLVDLDIAITHPSLGITLSHVERWGYAAFWILPDLIQDVHTRILRVAPLIRARTDCRFRFQRRFVTLWA
jgi:hypothetical protein